MSQFNVIVKDKATDTTSTGSIGMAGMTDEEVIAFVLDQNSKRVNKERYEIVSIHRVAPLTAACAPIKSPILIYPHGD